VAGLVVVLPVVVRSRAGIRFEDAAPERSCTEYWNRHPMYRETHARSVLKALSWRVLGTVATTLLVFGFTRRLSLSLSVGGVEFVSKIALYWLHERAWDRLRLGIQEVPPAVVWFTGLSGSGKSTIAKRVADELRGRKLRVEELDGDSIRHLFPNTGFSKADRDAHIARVGYLASKLEQNGVFVVASFVSPYRGAGDFVRGVCKNFIEIHVATPLAVCEERDVKGLYAKARRGEIANFTGISDPYEPPPNADLVLDTSAMSVEQAGNLVIAQIRQRSGKAWQCCTTSTRSNITASFSSGRPTRPSSSWGCCGPSGKTAPCCCGSPGGRFSVMCRFPSSTSIRRSRFPR